MNTIRDLLEDVKATLGLNIDDAEWAEGAILYNIGLAYDKIKGQDLRRHLSTGARPGEMSDVSTFKVPVLTDPVYERQYFEMPGPLFDLPDNGGIAYMAYYRIGLPPNCPPEVARTRFYPTTWDELSLLYGDPLQAPNEDRPRYIRAPERTWLFGLSQLIEEVEVGLYLGFPDLDSINPNTELNLPAHRVFDLRRMVLAQGNWLMLQPQERLLNDGRANDVGQRPQPTPPAMSVNDPLMINTAADQ